MLHRLRYLGLFFGMLLLCGSECEEGDAPTSLPVLSGKYYVVDLNGAGFVHDTVTVTFDSALELRLSSSDGRMADTPLDNLQRTNTGDYLGTVAFDDGVPGSAADVSIDVESEELFLLQISHNGVQAAATGRHTNPWFGALGGSLYNGDGSLAGSFSVMLSAGSAVGFLNVAPDYYQLTGTFSDLGGGHFYTTEGWPTTGVAMLGRLWVLGPNSTSLQGAGTWENVEGTASGTWTTE